MKDKIINLKSKVFTNSANNQRSITIPSKIFKQLEKQIGKPIEKIDVSLKVPKEVMDMKNRK